MARPHTNQRIPPPLFAGGGARRNVLLCLDENGLADSPGKFTFAGVAFVDRGELENAAALEQKVSADWDQWARARGLRRKAGRKYSADELREFVQYAETRMLPFAVVTIFGPDDIEAMQQRAQNYQALDVPGRPVEKISPKSIRWKHQLQQAISVGLALVLGAFGELRTVGVRIDKVSDKEEARRIFFEQLHRKSKMLASGSMPDRLIPDDIPVEVLERLSQMVEGMTTFFEPNPTGPLSDVPDVFATIASGAWTQIREDSNRWFARYTNNAPELVIQDRTVDLRRAIAKPVSRTPW